MSQRIRDFIQEFSSLSRIAANEAELRGYFVTAAINKLGLRDLKMERERQDIRRNKVIIEFKDKGLFQGSKTSAKFQEALHQLVDNYIPNQARQDSRPQSDYIGVCFDGLNLSFVFIENGARIRTSDLIPFDENSAAALVMALDRDDRIELTPQNIVDDFGPSSTIARATISALWVGLNISLKQATPRVVMLFREWQDLFEQSTSLGRIGQTHLESYFKSLGLPSGADPTKVLFVLHTYHALLFKLLSAELVLANSIVPDSKGDYCLGCLSLDDNALFHSLEHEIEESDLFRQVNILNFIEGTFFTWYLDSRTVALVAAIRQILTRISLYRLTNLQLETTRDVVKRIYQQIVPAMLRHNIGEFFTPEWLVEFTLNRVGYLGPQILTSRFLDPCCGSGNFLIHAIERFKKVSREAGWSDSAILRGIVDHIFGFDLNPLAVLTARVNYLIAISDLLVGDSEVEIPVFQADAIYAPTAIDRAGTIRAYHVGTHKRTIDISLPEQLIQQSRLFGRVLEIMETVIRNHDSVNVFWAAVNNEPQFQQEGSRSSWKPYLCDMFMKIQELEKIPWDRIWCRIVRNYFASVAVGKCKFVAGNPPWVRWSELPDRYTARIKPTCDTYKIFSQDRYFGGNELDISGMITYTVADKWLSDECGRLAFIITQTHFQSQSSGGFRRFIIRDVPLLAEQVDDFTEVRPFPGLANKPAVLTLVKGKRTSYPLPYIRWRRTASAAISEESSWAEIESQLNKEIQEANALSDAGQKWSILPKGRFSLLRVLDGADQSIVGRKGIVTDLNGVYFIDLLGTGRLPNTIRFRNSPNIGRHPVQARTTEIEASLVYPLIKGARNIRAFHATLSELYVIVPNTGITAASIPTGADLAASHPCALRYFREMNQSGILANRSTYRSRISPLFTRSLNNKRLTANDLPYHAIYDVGDYTFDPFKVVWAEMAGTVQAAVIGSARVPFGGGLKPIIPDHKVYYASFTDQDESHFICALLNSSIVREFIDSFTLKLQVGTLFRHIQLPSFNRSLPEHIELSSLSILAHKSTATKPNNNEIIKIKRSIDKIASIVLDLAR